jgi:cell division protease FtsH
VSPVPSRAYSGPTGVWKRQCRIVQSQCSVFGRVHVKKRGYCGVMAAASQQEHAGGAKKYLYEKTYGLPIVHTKLGYSELLRAMREEKIDEVAFFTQRGHEFLEGPCLVRFKGTNQVAQAVFPPNDARLSYAMETHGIRGSRLPTPPTAAQLNPSKGLTAEVSSFLVNVMPYVAVGLVYLATSYMKWKKGDAADRLKIKEVEAAERKKKEAEDRADQYLIDAEVLAGQGWSAADIYDKAAKAGIQVELDQVEAVVAKVMSEDASQPVGEYNTDAEAQLADEEAFRQKMKEAQAENDPNAQAEEFRKMKTVKIQKAQDPERLRKLKKAQKELKGVKLQYTDSKDVVFFDDIAGIGDAKIELEEIVDFFRKPERFKASGSRIPRGVLLCGPPGTGKTLLARAVAGEAGVSFLSLNASEFVEMFVGVGAARVRDLFATARSMSPAIIFIDEIDSVGRIRGGAQGNDERDQTLNQMLSEMDGFDSESQVVVMAATNRKDVLDPALIRPGRFDRSVMVPLPDYQGRIDILNVHLSGRPHDKDIDLHEIAFETRQYSGAQLANLVNMAATVATQRSRDEIKTEDVMKALEIERLGPERSRYSDKARKRLAVMEASTALLCTLLPAIEPVVLVTITPREKFPFGQTVVKANEGRELTQAFTKRYLEEQLLTVLAGRAAEEVYYGEDELSTMQQRRLVMARRIVTKLVVSTAMSPGETIGPRTLSIPKSQGSRSLAQIVTKFVSPELQNEANARMKSLLEESYNEAKVILSRNRDALDALIDELMQHDTITGERVRDIIEAKANPEDLKKREEHKGAFL